MTNFFKTKAGPYISFPLIITMCGSKILFINFRLYIKKIVTIESCFIVERKSIEQMMCVIRKITALRKNIFSSV